jgi:hypothetical protein
MATSKTSKTSEIPDLLLPFLEIGVSVAFTKLQAQGGPTDQEIEEARAWGERLPEVADLLVRSAPGAGAVLASTARALAVMIWVMPPGGSFDFLGVDWRRP